MIQERIELLRLEMKAAGIDCYLIPTSDDHDSEYVSSFFMVREFFSGFTGSAGTLVIWQEEAALFTDGRYFIQAERELQGTGIILMKSGEPGVPTIREYLSEGLKKGMTLAFDGSVVRADEAKLYEKLMLKKNGKLLWNADPAKDIWLDRPTLTFHPAFELTESYSGESIEDKLARLRRKMSEVGADIHVLTTLDDIAWLFNIRSKDVESCPVVLSFAVIEKESAILFTGKDKTHKNIDECLTKRLNDAGVIIYPYDSFYSYISKIQEGKLLLCQGRISYRVLQEIDSEVTLIDRPNPTTIMKAVKNPIEMSNLRDAHVKDGVAVTHFMYQLKTGIGHTPMTELSAAKELLRFREQAEHFLEPSFETICAYGSNGAIIHYSATPKQNARLEPKGLLMVDSGGHYLEGTTDITRTFVLGPVTDEMKKHFTLVLLAMLRLMNTKFLYGCRGVNLDIQAREVLWEHGLDYKHGTGHGVGYLLSVHEGPNSFRWRLLPDYNANAVLEEGMVTTDEPGIYIEGSHGIRIENELLCRKGIQNEYGQFMYFENLTFVPIDTEGVDLSVLGEQGRKWLNEYHKLVYEKLNPYFEGEEQTWLKNATKEI